MDSETGKELRDICSDLIRAEIALQNAARSGLNLTEDQIKKRDAAINKSVALLKAAAAEGQWQSRGSVRLSSL